LGVDACPSGWIATALPVPKKQSTNTNLKSQIELLQQPCEAESIFHNNFRELIGFHFDKADVIMIDIPIGLMDEGRRPCDGLVRKKLGPRASSVFPAPRRPMLSMKTYEEANQWGKNQGADKGGGLSKQAWHILPKIRDVDAVMTPELQTKVFEAHPELAFARLNQNIPCQNNKKKLNGKMERREILRRVGLINIDHLFDRAKELNWMLNETASKPVISHDDLLDSAALACTAYAKLSNKAIHCYCETKDKKGLRVEIWG